MPSVYGQRRAHLNPAEGRKLHEVLRDVSPDEAEEFKENVLSPAEIERRKHRKATPTPVRSEVPMSDTNLRASLIRLAHANPSLRADILPLVMKEAGTYKEYVDRKRKKGEKPLSEDAWRARTEGGGKAKTEEKKPEGGEKAEGGSKPKSPIPAKMYEYIGPDAVQIGDAIKAGKPIPKEEAERVIDLLEGVFDKAKAGKAIVPPSIMKHYKSLHKFLKAEGGSKSEKPGQPPAEGKKPKSFKKNYRPKMESVMKKHELTDDDGAQIIEFSLARPKKGKPQSPAELMRRFMQNAKPETKARMKNMSPADFMIMLRAVLDQEEGGAKAASLRTAAIRFAYENPALRKVILAALKEADEGSPEADKDALKEDADPASHDQNLASTWEKTAADFDYSPERGEVGGVRDDLIAALKKNGIQAEDDVSSNVLYIGDAKYAIHGPWLEGKGLGGRGKWIQKPTRAAWLAEAVKVLSKLAKK